MSNREATRKWESDNSGAEEIVNQIDRALGRRLRVSKRMAKTGNVSKQKFSSFLTHVNQKRSARRRGHQDKTASIERLLMDARERLKQMQVSEKNLDGKPDPTVNVNAAIKTEHHPEFAYESSTANLSMSKHKRKSSKLESEPAETSEPVVAQLALLAKLSSI